MILGISSAHLAFAQTPPSDAPRRHLYLNRVNINSVSGMAMKNVDIEIDADGNIHISSTVYRVKGEETPAAQPSATATPAAPIAPTPSPAAPVATPAPPAPPGDLPPVTDITPPSPPAP